MITHNDCADACVRVCVFCVCRSRVMVVAAGKQWNVSVGSQLWNSSAVCVHGHLDLIPGCCTKGRPTPTPKRSWQKIMQFSALRFVTEWHTERYNTCLCCYYPIKRYCIDNLASMKRIIIIFIIILVLLSTWLRFSFSRAYSASHRTLSFILSLFLFRLVPCAHTHTHSHSLPQSLTLSFALFMYLCIISYLVNTLFKQ